MKEQELVYNMIFRFFEEINVFNRTYLYIFQISFSGNIKRFEDVARIKLF